MQYIFILFCSLFFIGCSPKYKMVSEHVLPATEVGKECISKCQKQYGSCKEICEANFEICKTKAHKVAKKRYDQKMQEYVVLLERYVDYVRMYELERDLYFFDGFYGYRGYYYPRRMFWFDTYPVIRPHKPLKPRLSYEIQRAEMEICEIDCGCTKTYDECFVECGGVVSKKEVCIENCPDEK